MAPGCLSRWIQHSDVRCAIRWVQAKRARFLDSPNVLPKLVSVIIPVYNSADTIGECLESLAAQSYAADRLEIICVDGCSTDDSSSIISQYPVRLVANPERSVVAGRNRGFEAANGELIAFTDADCTFSADWIRNASTHLTTPGVAGVTGPVALPEGYSKFAECVSLLFEVAADIAHGGHRRIVDSVSVANHIPACNAIFREDCLRRIMPVPNHLTAGEDVVISVRLTTLGYTLLSAPDVGVFHHRKSCFSKYARQMYWYASARRQMARLNPALVHPFHLLLPPATVTGILGLSALVVADMSAFVAVSSTVLVAVTSLFGGLRTRSLTGAVLMPAIAAVMVVSWTLGFCVWRNSAMVKCRSMS